VNSSHGSLKSPLFEDRTFIYVPIPEKEEFQKLKGLATYSDIFSKEDLRFIPSKFSRIKVHYDPEFSTFTYGDYPTKKPRVANLKSVEKGDYIFFLSRLALWQNGKFSNSARFYLIGYLRIDTILKDIIKVPKLEYIRKIRNNAHILRIKSGRFPPDGFWVFKGDHKSELFKYAVPFTREFADKIMKDRYGKSWKWQDGKSELQTIGSYTRSSRVITNERRISHFFEHVRNNNRKLNTD
jgi:hypothetical protein